MCALRPPAIMQMGSPGLPSPMPEFSSINSSTYYRELHPRERETRPEGPELAKKRPLRYFLGTLLIFIGRAIKAREIRAREFASRLAICSFFFSRSDETLSSGLITSADDESAQLHAPNTDIRRIYTSSDFSFQK